MILSDADLVCKENPWPWTPGYGRVYHYSGQPNNRLTKVGFLKDANDKIIDIGDCSTPIICDWDNDGKLDLLLGTYGPNDETNAFNHEWRIYINTGTKEEYRFSDYSILKDKNGDPILASTLLIRDVDKDGKNDIVFSLKSDIVFAWYKNIGTKNAPEFNNYQDIDLPEGITYNFEFYELSDINGDDVLDLIYVNMYYPYYCLGKGSTFKSMVMGVNKNYSWKLNVSGQKVIVNFNSQVFINKSIIIYDVQGKIISKTKINDDLMIINLPHRGFYLMGIKTENGIEKRSFTIY